MLEIKTNNDGNLIKKKIINFHNNIVRTDDKGMEILSFHLIEILNNIIGSFQNNIITKNEYIEFLNIMYRMIGYTRDIIFGKGEYSISYMMIYVWYSFFPELAKYVLYLFVYFPSNQHPYGSWKDLKYFCEYCKTQNKNINHPLILYAIKLINNQLKTEINKTNKYSLVCKWIPREKSKYSWLFKELAKDYFGYYKNINTNIKSALKSFTNYRKIIGNLNKKLDTVQIKQCSNNWQLIEPSNLTSITILKQKFALGNKTKKGDKRINSNDRNICAMKFNNYVEINNIKVNTISIYQLVSDTIAIILMESYNSYKKEKSIINQQWNYYLNKFPNLIPIIPIIDTSIFMTKKELYNAIGLGLFVAEKSLLEKRILLCDNIPLWINLNDCNDFVDKVRKIYNNINQINTNIESSLDLIIMNNKNNLYKEKITVIVLSNKQLEPMTKNGLNIIYWNLSITIDDNLNYYNKNNILSGFSPNILDIYKNTKIIISSNNDIEKNDPYIILKKILGNKRYNPLEKIILNTIN
jgi:hypothetical protein